MTTTTAAQRPADPSARPTVGEVLKSILKHGILPGILVFAIVYAIGWVIVNPLNKLPIEETWARWFVGQRDGALDTITHFWSTSNDTWWTIGSAIVYGLIILVVTRKWWLGLLPVLAITLESSIFVIATNLTDRPRPEVTKLDPAPPTSSYPSGHTAASMSLYLSLVLLAQRIPNPVIRRIITVIGLIWPWGVAYSRLYRGMHHVSDVAVGLLLGVWCAFAAYKCIRIAEDEAAHRQALRADR